MWKIWLLLVAVILGGLGTVPGGDPEALGPAIPKDDAIETAACCPGPPPACPPLCNCPPHCNVSD